jgi:hypothetical protein
MFQYRITRPNKMPTTSEEFIASIIQAWGFDCNRIEETSYKRADFLVSDSVQSYLIELKTKFESPERTTLRSGYLMSENIFADALGLRPTAAYRSILTKAAKQLASMTEHDNATLRMPWLHCVGLQADVDAERFKSLLYGSVYIVDWADGGDAKSCYFFRHSIFSKYHHIIDAAIVSTEHDIWLCINPLSQLHNQVDKCRLAIILAEGKINPCQLELDDLAWIADADVDRRDERAVLKSVMDKYGLSDRSVVMEIEEISAASTI